MRPIVNVDELSWQSHEHGQTFAARGASISTRIGAQKLGYRITVVPPGMKAWPLHNHHANEEMFFILEGSGTLRQGNRLHAIRAGDFICSPAGDRSTAHQIINDSDAELHYLCVSTMVRPEITEYPDSEKFSAAAGPTAALPGAKAPPAFVHLGKTASEVDYWQGEI